MDNYSLVIDIFSDEENNRQSTPIKTVPVNIVGRLDVSDASLEAWRSSEAKLVLSSSSASIFESINSPRKKRFAPISDGKGTGQTAADSDDDFYEEPESPRILPPLQPATVLRDVTNLSPANCAPPTKIKKDYVLPLQK